jgi:hypothetical protein
MSSVLIHKVLTWFLGYEKVNALVFYKIHGYFPNIKNPRTFSEKINARKLSPIKEMSLLSDKVYVKEFLIDKGLGKYVIPNYYSGESLSLPLLESMPDTYMLKSNIGAGFNLLVTKELSPYDVLARSLLWNVDDFHYLGMEKHYKNIPPMYLIEQALLDTKGDSPKDYKFHCFADGTKIIAVYTGRGTDTRSDYFDEFWNPLNIRWTYPVSEELPAIPLCFRDMMIAVDLLYDACDAEYVRIDMYEFKRDIFFSEFTFTPSGGYSKFPNNNMDLEWGTKFRIF